MLQIGIVALPKSVELHRMAENIDVLDFSLTDDDMKTIECLDKYVSYKTNSNPLSAFLNAKMLTVPKELMPLTDVQLALLESS